MIQLTIEELAEQLPKLLGEFRKLGAAAAPIEIVDDLGRPVASLLAKDRTDALLSLVEVAGKSGEFELAQLSAVADAAAVERVLRDLGWSGE